MKSLTVTEKNEIYKPKIQEEKEKIQLSSCSKFCPLAQIHPLILVCHGVFVFLNIGFYLILNCVPNTAFLCLKTALMQLLNFLNAAYTFVVCQ